MVRRVGTAELQTVDLRIMKEECWDGVLGIYLDCCFIGVAVGGRRRERK